MEKGFLQRKETKKGIKYQNCLAKSCKNINLDSIKEKKYNF